MDLGRSLYKKGVTRPRSSNTTRFIQLAKVNVLSVIVYSNFFSTAVGGVGDYVINLSKSKMGRIPNWSNFWHKNRLNKNIDRQNWSIGRILIYVFVYKFDMYSTEWKNTNLTYTKPSTYHGVGYLWGYYYDCIFKSTQTHIDTLLDRSIYVFCIFDQLGIDLSGLARTFSNQWCKQSTLLYQIDTWGRFHQLCERRKLL